MARKRIIGDVPIRGNDLYNSCLEKKVVSTYLGTESGSKGSSDEVRLNCQQPPEKIKRFRKIDIE